MCVDSGRRWELGSLLRVSPTQVATSASYDRRVVNYYLVETTRGPTWDDKKPRREQAGWDAHTTFMDGLVEDHFIVLGGKVGELDGDRVFLESGRR